MIGSQVPTGGVTTTDLTPTRARYSTATISPDGLYRYDLTRRWRIGNDWLLFVMCNPSTADAAVDDPTIRRCIGFASREGFGGLAVVNLSAYRATNPRELWGRADSPDNRGHLAHWVTRATKIVAAWGATATPPALGGTRLYLRRLCSDAHKPLWCLGTTKDGHPRHPLYVAGPQRLVPWEA